MAIDVQDIAIPVDGIELQGSVAIPTRAAGLVIFAHGSGSGAEHQQHLEKLLELLRAPAAREDISMSPLRISYRLRRVVARSTPRR